VANLTIKVTRHQSLYKFSQHFVSYSTFQSTKKISQNECFYLMPHSQHSDKDQLFTFILAGAMRC